MLKNDIGEPTENQAIISVGRELRRLVEQNGTVIHWVKVKGHSEDVINDMADELATDGNRYLGSLLESPAIYCHMCRGTG